jgi:hypothetical protein
MNWTDWTSPSKHPTTVSFASLERFCAAPYEHVRFALYQDFAQTPPCLPLPQSSPFFRQAIFQDPIK